MKPIVATIAGSPTNGEAWEIFSGEVSGDFSPMTHLHLTEDHIFELITINKAWYQTQLVEGIKAGLISPTP